MISKIIACKDCKYCNGHSCHHPRSKTILIDYYDGVEETHYLTLQCARTLGPCTDGCLFEPLNTSVSQ